MPDCQLGAGRGNEVHGTLRLTSGSLTPFAHMKETVSFAESILDGSEELSSRREKKAVSSINEMTLIDPSLPYYQWTWVQPSTRADYPRITFPRVSRIYSVEQKVFITENSRFPLIYRAFRIQDRSLVGPQHRETLLDRM